MFVCNLIDCKNNLYPYKDLNSSIYFFYHDLSLYLYQNVLYMKQLISFLAISLLFIQCKERSLSNEYLSNIRVVRSMEKKVVASSVKKDTVIKEKPLEKKPVTQDLKYHIIVASFKETDKASAEKIVKQLKSENHPASLIYSSQRYRVSIAGFHTESEAFAALDKYRTITKRQDIWIHRVK